MNDNQRTDRDQIKGVLFHGPQRFSIARGDGVGIRVLPGGIWVDVDGGVVCCDPHKESCVLIFDGISGIGIFSWQPKKENTTALTLRSNVERVSGIIRGEEEKALKLYQRAQPIINKHLAGRSPTEEDYTHLWETYGLHKDVVDDLK